MSHQDLTRFAQNEFHIAAVELVRLPLQEAQIRCYGRLDEAMGDAARRDAVDLACRAGCAYCCHYKIEALPMEVLAIKQFVVKHFQPEQIRKVMDQAKRNVKEAKGMSHLEQMNLNQRCAFLLDNQCSIYPVRPSNCRIYHSTDLHSCKTSFEQPEVTLANSMVGSLQDAGGGTAEGFLQAAERAGMDTRAYDLSSAFIEAMQSPDLAKRLTLGKKAFVSAKLGTRAE